MHRSLINQLENPIEYSDGKFVYDGILKDGESASFDVIFDTTKIGEFENTVVAGSNSTDNVTSTNTTTVKGNATDDNDDPDNSSSHDDDDLPEEDDVHNNSTNPEDDDVPEEDDVPDEDTTNPEDETEADDVEGSNMAPLDPEVLDEFSDAKSDAAGSKLATGNPIFALLMVLITMAGVARRSKK